MSIYDLFYITTIALKESFFVRVIFVSIILVAYSMYKNPREDFYNDKENY